MSLDLLVNTLVTNQERIIALLEQIATNQKLATSVAGDVALVLQANHEAVTHTVGSVSKTEVKPREKSGDEMLGDDKAAMKKEAAQAHAKEASSPAKAAQSAEAPAASAASTAPGAAEQGATSASAVPLTKGDGKRITADDARKAIKAFAGIEGNEAAMELIGSFNGAGSVSAVAEQGDEAVASLFWKAGGK